MISDSLASAAKPRPDINSQDSVQTVWIELSESQLLIGGAYRQNRNRQPDLEKEELDQLSSQVFWASATVLNVLLIGDTNLDHMNPNHRKATEANEFLQYIKVSIMQHLQTGPTWQSHGLFKNCNCPSSACYCPRLPLTSTIDIAIYSISMNANIKVLPDTISDHLPLLVDINQKSEYKNSKLETMWTRDLSKVHASDFEAALVCYNWLSMYAMSDPDEAAVFLIKMF